MEFVDERGLRWDLSEFCTHDMLDKDAAMKLFGELDHPARLDTRDFVQSCNPKMKKKTNLLLFVFIIIVFVFCRSLSFFFVFRVSKVRV